MSVADQQIAPPGYELEYAAIRLCREAADDPYRPRWTDYLEQARALMAAKAAEAAQDDGA